MESAVETWRILLIYKWWWARKMTSMRTKENIKTENRDNLNASCCDECFNLKINVFFFHFILNAASIKPFKAIRWLDVSYDDYVSVYRCAWRKSYFIHSVFIFDFLIFFNLLRFLLGSERMWTYCISNWICLQSTIHILKHTGHKWRMALFGHFTRQPIKTVVFLLLLLLFHRCCH